MFLSKEKTILRKVLEAFITVKIEQTLTKNEILERYLNVIEFSPQIFGIKKASLVYFKKSPADLNPIESAFLAMVLPNPKKYSISYYKKSLTKFAQKRMAHILNGLAKTGRLSDEELSLSLNELPTFLSDPNLDNSQNLISEETPETTSDELDSEDADWLD